MKIYTASDIAKEVGVTPAVIIKDIDQGILKAKKNGYYWIIEEEAAKKYIVSKAENLAYKTALKELKRIHKEEIENLEKTFKKNF